MIFGSTSTAAAASAFPRWHSWAGLAAARLLVLLSVAMCPVDALLLQPGSGASTAVCLERPAFVPTLGTATTKTSSPALSRGYRSTTATTTIVAAAAVVPVPSRRMAALMSVGHDGASEDSGSVGRVLAVVGAPAIEVARDVEAVPPKIGNNVHSSTTSTEEPAIKTTRIKQPTAVRALPGTWWAAGLPKWMHTARRRLITKEDIFHIHAASGMLWLGCGSLWLLNVMGLELFTGIPQLETGTPIPLLLLGAGLTNVLSSIPMADTRSWLMNVVVTVIQLWLAWHISGAYPASFAVADPWVAAAALSVLVINAVEAEESIARGNKAKELARVAGQRWPPKSGKITMRAGDEQLGDNINRYGALANFVLNAPHLYATLVGSGWVQRLAEAYPSAPALIFHTYFAVALTVSISLLAPTLYTRRLIDAQTMTVIQLFSAAPLIVSAIDNAVMGAATTNNPIEIYLGFLQ